MARPTILGDGEQREICALVTAGMSLAKIARYVGCDPKTILRLRQTNPDFDSRVRQALKSADLKPLESMRRAANDHWRAAAWMLERDERQETARREASFTSWLEAELVYLSDAVKLEIRKTFDNPIKLFELEKQLDEIFRGSNSRRTQRWKARPALRKEKPHSEVIPMMFDFSRKNDTENGGITFNAPTAESNVPPTKNPPEQSTPRRWPA